MNETGSITTVIPCNRQKIVGLSSRGRIAGLLSLKYFHKSGIPHSTCSHERAGEIFFYILPTSVLHFQTNSQ